MKNILAFLLCACIMILTVPINAYADASNDRTDSMDEVVSGVAAVPQGSIVTTKNILNQYKWHSETGHGFAAERGNNLIDRIKGKNTKVVGDNNAPNGPDRIIINRDGTRVYIQDKYYSSAGQGIGACFDDVTGMFRYVNEDGSPMQIEVPKDQYETAVECMKKKIEAGKVEGVSDPAEAENIVRKGNLTYEQAKNLAKAGTFESLKYDAVHGVVSGGVSFGISTLLNYAIGRAGGADRMDALKSAAVDGLKTGGLVFGSSVLASQLCKTNLVNAFKPASEKLVAFLGKHFAETIVSATGETVTSDVITQAARLLRGQVIVGVVTTVAFSLPDLVDVFRGRISAKQFAKNISAIATGIAAGTAGYFVGSAIGSVPGGLIGSVALGTAGSWVADKLSDLITSDDADEMYALVSDVYISKCEDYLISVEEGDRIAEKLSGMMDERFYKDMYQSKDREAFISDILTPLFEEEVSKREKVEIPTELELREALKEELAGIVLIH